MEVIKCGNITIQMEEPVVLVQAEAGDIVWGHCQFPGLYHMMDGSILAGWQYCKDDIYYEGYQGDFPTNAISGDQGKTWNYVTSKEIGIRKGTLMKNGKYFMGFARKSGHKVDYWNRYTPGYYGKGDEPNLYFLEDMEKNEDTTVYASEYDPVTGETTMFEVALHWPNAPICQYTRKGYEDVVYPMTMRFALCDDRIPVELDGALYFAIYAIGFDSDAAREQAVYPYAGLHGVYVFRSDDCGHTWEYVSQLLPNEMTYREYGHYEGLGEPVMAKMPDGSVIILMRSGFTHPTYIARSTDDCKTWTDFRQFDDIGVYPQLLPLKCGVTLATYGRPAMKLRATDDPSGMDWEDPIELMPYSWDNIFKDSCYNTALLPLDDCSALFAYSDFNYPNPDGIPVRTVLVRRITVETNREEL